MENLTAMRGIPVKKVERSKLQDIPESIPFGKYSPTTCWKLIMKMVNGRM